MQKKSKKTGIAIGAVNAVLLVVFGIIYLNIYILGRDNISESAKNAWDGGVYKYGQVSLFLAPENGIDLMGAYSLRQDIEGKLKDASVSNKIKGTDGEPDRTVEGRLWIDCGYGEANVTVSGVKGSCDVTAGGTYNDFFIFHPEKLLSGSYYTPESINTDTVVIDKQCSWQLFGGIDTAGMTVTISGREYRVAAVVDCPFEGDALAAYGDRPRIYMPYEALCNIVPGTLMTSYEICIPNVVKDFPKTVMTQVNSAPEKKSAVVDQTGRFGIAALFKGFGNISQSAIVDTSLAYPWYENKIRAAEIKAKILAGFGVYLLIIPLISTVYGLFCLVKALGAAAKKIKNRAEDAYQKKISEAYYEKRGRMGN